MGEHFCSPICLFNAFKWEATIPSLNFSTRDAMPSPAIGWRYLCFLPEIAGGYSIPEFYIDKATIPHMHVDTHPHYIAGGNLYYPKDMDCDPVTLTFYEDKFYRVIRYLYKWRSMVVDDDGNYGLPGGPRGYKRNIEVIMQDERGLDALKIVYVGAYPARPGEFAPDGETSGRIITSCQFSVDGVYLDNVGTGPDRRDKPPPNSANPNFRTGRLGRRIEDRSDNH